MNVITRGARNALRSPVRSGAIVAMLAISIGLILSMLVAQSSVNKKIEEVKAATATKITINPAGIQGGMGGGDPLTAAEVSTIEKTTNVTKTTATLTDQLGTGDTNLTPSLTLGGFGRRQQRFEQGATNTSEMQPPTSSTGDSSITTARPAPTPRTSITGTDTPSAAVTTAQITSGAMIDGTGSDLVAMIGKTLAEKNNLSVGDTFTAYNKTFTVKAIFNTANTFQDSGTIVPLATLQTATDQVGAVTAVTATVNSSDNTASTVSALKTSLADKADITSQADQAETTLQPLKSIATLALTGVIAAAAAGALIILLAMIMIVRERRREIGVIKAIGGTNRKVVGQFMSEALTLTIAGSIVGMALGVLVSGPITQSLVSNQTTASAMSVTGTGNRSFTQGPRGFSQQLTTNVKDVTSTLSPQTFAISIGLILPIAIIGSAVPAWFIARVRPAEVLRTE